MFLVRSAFWLSVVILLLPAEENATTVDLSKANEKVTAGQAFVAAKTTVDDLSGFCLRNQVTCQTGKAAFQTFIKKAQYGANLLSEWVSGMSTAQASAIDPEKFSSLVTPKGKATSAANLEIGGVIKIAGSTRKSQNTLTKEDLVPNWGGPAIKTKT